MTHHMSKPGQMPLLFGQSEQDNSQGQDDAHWLAEAERGEGGGLRAVSRELRAIELIVSITDLRLTQAETIMRKAGGLHKLAQMPEYALRTLPHVGQQEAQRIRALTEWALLLNEAAAEPNPKLRTPADIANLVLTEMGLLEKEELRVMGLDTKNHLMGMETVYRGSVNGITIRVGEVMRMPISLQCTSMALVHNHPSGDPTPSPQDVRLTGKIAEAAKQLDIDLLDHLVIGRNRFVSMRERGLGFG